MPSEDSKAFLHFKDIIQSYQQTNGGIVAPELTEPGLFLDNIIKMK